MPKSTVRRRGFTIIELVTVVGIVAVLIAAILPAIGQAREAARKSSCKNNLKQLGTAMHNYHETHNILPPGWLSRHPNDSTGGESWAWSVQLMPYMG